VISCPDRSDIFSVFFEAFPEAGLTGDGKTFSTVLAAVVFGGVCLSAGAATPFCVSFPVGFAAGVGTAFAAFTGAALAGFTTG
jgi:hypothetical protein